MLQSGAAGGDRLQDERGRQAMARKDGRSGLRRRKEQEDGAPKQLPLVFAVPVAPVRMIEAVGETTVTTPKELDRVADLDQRISTRDVLRVVGVNRSTIFRWTRKGMFPAKHPSGGWRKSDIERWLAENRLT